MRLGGRAAVTFVLIVALVGGLCTVVGAEGGREVRVVARRHVGGAFEVALQERGEDGVWGDRRLPARRFVAAGAPVGDWQSSSPLVVGVEEEAREVRVVARRHAGGGFEVALQERGEGGVWGDRRLPVQRFVHGGASPGRWHTASPLVIGGSPAEVDGRGVAALITPTGVPVAVVGRTEHGWLVRTPCGAETTVATGTVMGPVRVVLDPGHGGPFESGAIGPNGLAEDELNLTLSRAVLTELAARGIPATTTRTGDYGVLLAVRAMFADALDVDALVSIHHNAPTPRVADLPGTEVYAQSAPEGGFRFTSARLGGLLHQEITAALVTFDGTTWSRRSDAGVLRVLLPENVQSSRDGLYGGDAYGVIRASGGPAVIVEYGYLSNASEAELFATDRYISVAAVATADAIEAYLSTDRSGTEPIERPRVFDPVLAPSRCNEVPLE